MLAVLASTDQVVYLQLPTTSLSRSWRLRGRAGCCVHCSSVAGERLPWTVAPGTRRRETDARAPLHGMPSRQRLVHRICTNHRFDTRSTEQVDDSLGTEFFEQALGAIRRE